LVESTSMDLDPFKGKFMSNEYVSVGQVTVHAPESAPIETFSRTTAKHWTAWRELMAEIMASPTAHREAETAKAHRG